MQLVSKGSPQRNGELAHEEKVIDIIRRELRQARAAKMTGKLTFDVELFKGDATKTYTQVGVTYKVLEQLKS